jgi:hypothetical protein
MHAAGLLLNATPLPRVVHRSTNPNFLHALYAGSMLSFFVLTVLLA